jgi:hypothetical protein
MRISRHLSRISISVAVLCVASFVCFVSADSASAAGTNGRKCIAAVPEITREKVKEVELNYVKGVYGPNIEIGGYKLITITSNSWIKYSSGTEADACKDAFLNGNFASHYDPLTPTSNPISVAPIINMDTLLVSGWGFKGTGTDGDAAACLNLVRYDVPGGCDLDKTNLIPDCKCTDEPYYSEILATGNVTINGVTTRFRVDENQDKVGGRYNGKLDGGLNGECALPPELECDDDPNTPNPDCDGESYSETGVSKTQTCAVNDTLGQAACDPTGTSPDDEGYDEFKATASDPEGIVQHNAPTQLARPGDQIYFDHYFDKGAQKLNNEHLTWVGIAFTGGTTGHCSGEGAYWLEGAMPSSNAQDCQKVSGPETKTPLDLKVSHSHGSANDAGGVAGETEVLNVADDCFSTGRDGTGTASIHSIKSGVPAFSTLGTIPPCGNNHNLARNRSQTATVTNADVGSKELYQKVTLYDRVALYLHNCQQNMPECENTYKANTTSDNAGSAGDTTVNEPFKHTFDIKWKDRHSGSCSSGTGSENCGYSCSGSYDFYGADSETVICCGCKESSTKPAYDSAGGPYSDGYDGTGTYVEYEHDWVRMVDHGPVSSNAQFNTPYNYQLVPEINPVIPAQRMLVGGSDWNYTTQIHTIDYYNEEFGESYATITRPDTHWEVSEFYISENTLSNPNSTSNQSNSLSPCSFYRYNSGIQNVRDACRVVDSGTGSLNDQSGQEATSSIYPSEEAFRNHTAHVADAPPGTKFCIGLSVYNEFSRYGNESSTYGDPFPTSPHWVHAAPECITISKIPTMQIWGGGLYSEGPVIGRYAEKLNASEQPPSSNLYLGWLADTSSFNHPSDGWKSFGSWSEYEAIGRGIIAPLKTWGSGAAFGRGLTIPQPLGGGASSTVGCSLTRLSIRNTNSATNTSNTAGSVSYCNDPGQNNENIGKSTVFKGLAHNILNRYQNRVAENTWLSGDPNDPNKVDGSNNPVYQKGTWNGGTIPPGNAEFTYYRSAGDATIEATNIGKGKTVIVEIGGTARINGDITYADINANPNVYESAEFAGIDEIPQVIIFAKNIDIAPKVHQIDAWLMVGIGSTGSGSGVINTCANGVTAGTLVASNKMYETDTSTEPGVDSLSRECNQRLKINGPVQAKQLKLYRTHGAGMGLGCRYDYDVNINYNGNNQAQWPNGGRYTNCGTSGQYGSGAFPVDSATPAEVFNLRADAYLWAYRQAENYSQAFVTYQREVAPRF